MEKENYMKKQIRILESLEMRTSQTFFERLFITIIFCAFLTVSVLGQFQFDINGPNGSDSFGTDVVILPNGNFVVTDPDYDIPAGAENVGAVYLYSSNGTLISTLTGSTAEDQIGLNGITVLPNGNFLIVSLFWDGAETDVGAVTFGDGTNGVSGTVSDTNSLVGSTANDQVGEQGITVLANGNYLVRSSNWDGAEADVGAVTFGNGTNGITGVVSDANSLIGSTADDQVGHNGIDELTNGNYVVRSNNWDNAEVSNAGAVTWGNGSDGISGIVSSANSLVGTTTNDRAGQNGVVALSNGNYIVRTSNWDGTEVDVGAATWGNGTTGISGTISETNSLVGSGAGDRISSTSVESLPNGSYVVISELWNGSSSNLGAVTWGDGTNGITGAVSSSNSLVGSTEDDNVGDGGIVVLSNGNYVVISSSWDRSSTESAGAVTWADGTSGISGEITDTNSLVGSSFFDRIGRGGVTALTNGNYVVASPFWVNGSHISAGAVTWGNGTTGITGEISISNSLVGSNELDEVGNAGVMALTNGNYVISSPDWDGSSDDIGAVTWGDGTTGSTGRVSAANSIVGSTSEDFVGSTDILPLTNGNYVVSSTRWDSSNENVGAVTLGDGTNGTALTVSAENSLVGVNLNDHIGSNVVALPNGNYVVISSSWDNNGAANLGAVTFGDGVNGVTGHISASNSLVGSTANDRVGRNGINVLENGNYIVHSPLWDNGVISNAGAVTLINGNTGSFSQISSNKDQSANTNNLGVVSEINSVRGTAAGGGSDMNFDYDENNDQLIVGRPADNIVTLLNRNAPGNARADFDGDGVTDISVFRPSEGNWYLNQSSGGFAVLNWGISSDTLVPADYDGDGKTDPAVFRPTDTLGVSDFLILNSKDFTLSGFEWGVPGDVPVVGDYDGDGKADVSVWRESDTTWYTNNSSDGSGTFDEFGLSGDIPVVGDWDGDGKNRPGIFRPGDNTWYLARATGDPGTNFDAIPFGDASDLRVPGDYDGDGKTDIAVFRASDGNWYIRSSESGNTTATGFGAVGDEPVPGDYDGDGKDDLAVYRDGDWWILRSNSGSVSASSFGIATDTPVPGRHNP